MTQPSFFRHRSDAYTAQAVMEGKKGRKDRSFFAPPRFRTILHCDLNNFFASVELLSHPELVDKPVAVGGSVAERHGIVLAKNQLAKQYGIGTGEALKTAYEKCPGLTVLPPHYDRYLEYSRRVRAVYCRYTDQVEAMGIDECFLDVTGSRSLFGDGEEIANRIREEVKRDTGLTISVGVSFNKIFAKLGSDMKKPDAVTVIPPEKFKEIVWDLPANEMLGVGRKTYKKLYERGIRTIGDMASCPVELMRSYLGKMGEVLWVYANGYENSPVMHEEERCPIQSIGHGTTTREDLVSEREVFDLIIELMEEVGCKLRRNGLKAGGVVVGIRENDLTTREYQMKLDCPTQLTRELARAAMVLFHEKHVWRRDIRSVSVRAIYIASQSAPEQIRMLSDGEKRASLLMLEHTVDDLRERYGEHAVTSGSYYCAHKLSSQRIGFQNHSEIY